MEKSVLSVDSWDEQNSINFDSWKNVYVLPKNSIKLIVNSYIDFEIQTWRNLCNVKTPRETLEWNASFKHIPKSNV